MSSHLDGFVSLQGTVGQFENVRPDARLLSSALHVDITLGHAFYQDVPLAVHFHLNTLKQTESVSQREIAGISIP